MGVVDLISSPALAAIENKQSDVWVTEWVKTVCVEDGPGDAEKYAGIVVGLGVKSRRRLAQLQYDELIDEGVPRLTARALMAQAEAQFALPASAGALFGDEGTGAGGGAAAVAAWSLKGIEDFPKGMAVAGEFRLPSMRAVLAHMTRVITYADAKTASVASALDCLVGDPGMGDDDFAALEDQANVKLMLVGTMGDDMGAYIVSSLGRRATGLAVARLLLKPQVAQSEAMVGVATQGVVKPGMLEHGTDLGMALTKWLDHLKYLEERQEAPSDHQCMESLKRMTAKLGLESELQVEARVVKRTGGVWDAKGMLEYLQSKVPEYPEESRPAKPKATAKVAKVEGRKQERKQESHATIGIGVHARGRSSAGSSIQLVCRAG